MLVKFLTELLIELLKAGIVFDPKLHFFLLVNDAHGQALDASNVNIVRCIELTILEPLGMQTLRGPIVVSELLERIARVYLFEHK